MLPLILSSRSFSESIPIPPFQNTPDLLRVHSLPSLRIENRFSPKVWIKAGAVLAGGLVTLVLYVQAPFGVI
jgi:hypothetical protein